jgi:ABC-2 type transport system ATP-binding protein
VLVVEVADAGDGAATERLAQTLGAGALSVRTRGALVEVDLVDGSTFDAVRDAVADLGLGLVRMQQRRHRMEEVFHDDLPA